jgi:5-methylcytosine-specific restriction enzyme B
VQHVIEQRHGYAPIVVTATEDWGVRDVVGGIGPRLDESGGSLRYAIEYGALTRTVLQHYKDSEGGRKLPTTLVRRDYQHEQGRRYRGAWLVIDEFTRAPIDAAFGSLLTTLSGGEQARLAVPTSTNEPREISLPADFRIIGTLNSFDRHFLNQISEAMKRRFDFIDVLPPPPKDAILEQGIAVMQALRRVAASGYSPIERTGNPPTYTWPGVVNVSPETVDGRVGYRWHAGSDAVTHTLHSFWRIFSAIRVFRQLGTAQMVAVYTNLFTGVLIGMEWSAALDSALADALADQLQVLNRDEQRVLDALLEHSGNHALFAGAVQAIVRSLPAGRRAAFSHALREHDLLLNGSSDIGIGDGATLNEAQLGRVFDANDLLALPKPGLFRRRLRDLIGERGL